MIAAKSKRPAHFTREHQRMARHKVSSESCARNGTKGAAATRAKYGERFLFMKWRQWKLDNPSRPELLIIGILARLNLRVEREFQLAPSFQTLDFYFPDCNKGLEFHGRIHTRLNREQREACDVRKRELLASAGIETLWVEHSELENVPVLARKIEDFVTGKGTL
jgi:hypothetical protein